MNKIELENKVKKIANSLIYEKGYICAIDMFLKLDYLKKKDYEDWRLGKIEYLEKACKINLSKLSTINRTIKKIARDLKLEKSWTKYNKYGKGIKHSLIFSKSGDKNIEYTYATHYLDKRRINELNNGQKQSMTKAQKQCGDEVMNTIKYKPIGIIHSPFKQSQGTPIQSIAAIGIDGTVEVFPEYVEGLKDINGFSHIILIYHFHLTKNSDLIVKPYMDKDTHGVFATRAPTRPNSIGISIVRLIKIEGIVLNIRNLDIVDGTPLLDIKPYVPEFDIQEVEKTGWLERNVHKLSTSKDDGRFAK